MTSEDIYMEYIKCLKDDCYAINSLFTVMDQTQGGFVPFKLYKKQEEIVKAFSEHRHNIIAKPRQAGISTTTQAFLAVKAAFASKNKPEVILVIANKLELSKKFANAIKDFIKQMPRWVFGENYYGSKEKEKRDIFTVNSKTEIQLGHNGSKIIAVATSGDALRGYSPTYLVFDEAAFIDDGITVYTAAMASISTGGKAILISTPNGQDPLYYETYKGSIQQENTNGFNSIEMRWYQDPRYNVGMSWLNKEGEVDHDEDRFEQDKETQDYYEEKIRRGLKPTSNWYKGICKDLGNNKRKIAQELDVSFLGSGGNVVDDEFIITQERENVRNPIYVDNEWFDGDTNQVFIFDEPIEGHKYILAADVSTGDGSDSSTFSILDSFTLEQVAEFQGKLPPDVFARVIYKYGILYNAYVVVDNIGYGATTAYKLREMEYPNLHYDDVNPRGLISDKKAEEVADNSTKVPGFNITGSRIALIANLEEKIRLNEVKIRSRRVIVELRTFIYKNGRPDHANGKHDDCIMALGMALWILESSFKRLESAKTQTMNMLDAWVTCTSIKETGVVFESKEQEERIKSYYNPFDFNIQENLLTQDQTRTYRNQSEYSWLFGR